MAYHQLIPSHDRGVYRGTYAAGEMENPEQNDYVLSVLDPWTGGTFIPDNVITPTTTKTTNYAYSFIVPTAQPDAVIVWTPYRKFANLVMYLRGEDLEIAIKERLIFSHVIYPDQDISETYKWTRLVSGGLRLEGTTLSGSSFTVSGTMNVATIQDLPVIQDMRHQDVISYMRSPHEVMRSTSLATGAVVTALPTGPQRLESRVTDAVSNYRDSLDVFIEGVSSFETDALAGGFSETVLDLKYDELPPNLRGNCTVTYSGYVGNSTVGDLNCRIWLYVNHMHMTVDGVISKVTKSDLVTVMVPPLNGVNSGAYFQCVVRTYETPIDQIAVVLQNPVTTAEFHGNACKLRIECPDYGSIGTAGPAAVFSLSGYNAGQQVTISGLMNYEVVPEADTSRDIATKFGGWRNPEQMQLAEMIFANAPKLGISTVYPLPAYHELQINGFFRALAQKQTSLAMGYLHGSSLAAGSIHPTKVRETVQNLAKVHPGGTRVLGNLLGMIGPLLMTLAEGDADWPAESGADNPEKAIVVKKGPSLCMGKISKKENKKKKKKSDPQPTPVPPPQAKPAKGKKKEPEKFESSEEETTSEEVLEEEEGDEWDAVEVLDDYTFSLDSAISGSEKASKSLAPEPASFVFDLSEGTITVPAKAIRKARIKWKDRPSVRDRERQSMSKSAQTKCAGVATGWEEEEGFGTPFEIPEMAVAKRLGHAEYDLGVFINNCSKPSPGDSRYAFFATTMGEGAQVPYGFAAAGSIGQLDSQFGILNLPLGLTRHDYTAAGGYYRATPLAVFTNMQVGFQRVGRFCAKVTSAMPYKPQAVVLMHSDPSANGDSWMACMSSVLLGAPNGGMWSGLMPADLAGASSTILPSESLVEKAINVKTAVLCNPPTDAVLELYKAGGKALEPEVLFEDGALLKLGGRPAFVILSSAKEFVLAHKLDQQKYATAEALARPQAAVLPSQEFVVPGKIIPPESELYSPSELDQIAQVALTTEFTIPELVRQQQELARMTKDYSSISYVNTLISLYNAATGRGLQMYARPSRTRQSGGESFAVPDDQDTREAAAFLTKLFQARGLPDLPENIMQQASARAIVRKMQPPYGDDVQLKLAGGQIRTMAAYVLKTVKAVSANQRPKMIQRFWDAKTDQERAAALMIDEAAFTGKPAAAVSTEIARRVAKPKVTRTITEQEEGTEVPLF